MPEISVIVPIYNTEKYLRQCIDSIREQKNVDLEILLMNDGSTDSSPRILEECANADPRIRVFHKPNSGYGDTMNCGLRNARGTYVAFVESDDFILPDFYQTLLQIAEKRNCDLVKSDFFCFNDSRKYRKTSTSLRDCYERELHSADALRIFRSVPEIAHWSALYRRSFLEENHIFFNPTPGASYQDLGFYFKVLLSLRKFCLTRQAFYMYRTDNAGSSMKSLDKYHCLENEIDSVRRFAAAAGLPDNILEPALRINHLFHAFLHYRRMRADLAKQYRTEILALIRGIGWKNYKILPAIDKIRAPLFVYCPFGFRCMTKLRTILLPE